ncbi:MAG: Flp family type IVb pilin [Firmicutes bacterium]|nr:Flp family type IVb pilin [Bacillota bacterium]MCL5057962.1 Flp family type IVb pilin [Actinomycetota bacterium]
MLSSLYSIIVNEDGQGIAEYALIMAFVALACAGAFGALGPAVRDRVAAFAGSAYN